MGGYHGCISSTLLITVAMGIRWVMVTVAMQVLTGDNCYVVMATRPKIYVIKS